MMTDEEKDIILLLGEVYEKYVSLKQQHYGDLDEFVNALHVLQHLVMIRGVRRDNPEMFPINLKAEVSIDDLSDTKKIEVAISETLRNALGNEEPKRVKKE